MTEARIGWGGKVYLSTDNTEANLTLLAEVVDTTFPQDETDEVEATHLNSPGRRKEFLAGLIDGGEVTINLNYVPGAATDLLLTAAKEAGTTRKVRFVIPDDSGTGAADWNIVTSGFVKRYAPDTMSAGAKIGAVAVIRITGAQEQGTGAAGS
jgi:xanthine/CO dehydrogenase XdhC/CoxF family maturation factor